MHDLSALFTLKVQLVVQFQITRLLYVFLSCKSEALNDPRHVSLISSRKAELKPSMELVFALRLVILEGRSLESFLPIVPDLTLRTLLKLVANELMRVNAVVCKPPKAEGALYAVLAIRGTCHLAY